MAAKIYELRAKRQKLAQEANAALDAAQATAKAENRALTAEELAAQDEFDAKLDAIDTEIQLEQRKIERARKYGSADPVATTEPRVPGSGPQPEVRDIRLRAEDDPRRGFSDHRDFLLAVMEYSGLRDRADVGDERLRMVAVADDDRKSAGELAFILPAAFTPRSLLAAAGSDEQGGYADRYGGFAVGTTLLPGLMQTGMEADPTAGRTQPLPMQSPAVEIMARTDKDHTTSVAGGLIVTRRPETVAANPSRFELEKILMKASSLFGLAYATEEILTDSPISFVAIIDSGFRSQFPFHKLNEKLRGKGGAEFLGVLNSPAKVVVAAEGGQSADTILALNVIKMDARLWGPGIWIANQGTKPQLRQLHIPVTIGTGGGLLAAGMYQSSIAEGQPDRLLGRPIFFHEQADKLGDEGDLILVNWSQYLEGVYTPLQSAESVHVRFVNHERAFKFWERNAGAPWWRAPLTPHKGADTLSPIVTLAAR